MSSTSRLAGLVAPDLDKKTALAAGNGGGSSMTVMLGRIGVGHLVLVDPDTVEPENLMRTSYTTLDIGMPKAERLKHFLQFAAPSTKVEAHVGRVQDVLADGFAPGNKPDLLIAGTDSFEAQAFINKLALAHNIPAIFIGVHARGAGGIITLVLPGRTPCYRCVCRRRYELHADGYSRLDLPGAIGTGIDVGFIDHVALKIAVAVLSEGSDTDYGRLMTAIGSRTQVIVRTHPEYRFGDNGLDIFDLVLSDLPTSPKDYKRELQAGAFLCCDTLWLQPDFDPECPDCKEFRHA